MTRYIFITGGVVSSLGKGIAAASLGALLQARGYSVRIRKLDGYLNLDPGTMSPYQHGEVFVTEDGCETDLDLGHYERFTGVNHHKTDSTTMGKIYSNILAKERHGDYLGGTVQVVPHVIDEIKNFLTNKSDESDFVISEIGGTVGDIESLPFLEAIRQMAIDYGRENTLFIHLTLVPYIAAAGELKSKATQHSVRTLLSYGIQPDMLLCRCDRPLSDSMKQKIGLFCNVKANRVFAAEDASSIYKVPLALHMEKLDYEVCHYFGLKDVHADLSLWSKLVQSLEHPKQHAKIAIVGKYVKLKDSYKSIIESLTHAGMHLETKINICWIDASDLEDELECEKAFEGVQGVLVPGGFGERGIKGKLKAIRYAREGKIPFFGICLGMQLAVIEATRNIANIDDATSSELDPHTGTHVVGLMTEWEKEGTLLKRSSQCDLGGTMRLGSYPCTLQKGSLAEKAYKEPNIQERHRHRYEVNLYFKDIFEKAGIVFSGMSPDGVLPEIIERNDHPWFVAVQFHPEFKSKPLTPHPLFVEFVQAALDIARTEEI